MISGLRSLNRRTIAARRSVPNCSPSLVLPFKAGIGYEDHDIPWLHTQSDRDGFPQVREDSQRKCLCSSEESFGSTSARWSAPFSASRPCLRPPPSTRASQYRVG